MKSKAPKPLPETQQEAFVNAQLYTCFSLDERQEEELNKFFLGGGTVDAWCPSCRCPSVFHIKSQLKIQLSAYGEQKKSLPHHGIIAIEAVCGRGGTESYYGCSSIFNVVFVKDGSEVTKIGQNPSMADLEFGALDEAFNKELTDPFRRELGTAIGLYSHGVGIGSFVYLRRIFEALVEEAHQLACKDEDWDESESEYSRLRVSEKLDLLKGFLPARLIQTAHLYGILSLGIHELSEDECLENFELVKGAIELILKDRHEAKRYEKLVKGVNQKSQELQQNAVTTQVKKICVD